MKRISFAVIESTVRDIIKKDIDPNQIRENQRKILIGLEYLEKRMERIENLFTDTLAFVTEVMKNFSNS
ncbi:MAG: hypothetical protein DRO88_11925 [Promethearchaeia archaeon]|nr:MAG: hypothetical protein DRO88_11925 [Candidatus Lokiarchaeia archaeon]